MSDRITAIKARLTEHLKPTYLDVTDDSAHHIGHAHDGGGHFTVTLSSPLFAGKTLVQQHQLVYQTLGDLMKRDIHALVINIKS